MERHWLLIAFVLILVSGCLAPEWDMHAEGYDFTLGLAESGIDAEKYAKGIDAAIKASSSNLERAELLLVMGRMKNDKSLVSFAMDFYHKAVEEAENKDERAIIFEAIAGIESSRYNHLRAAEAWRRAGNWKRAVTHFNLAAGRKNEWQFDTGEIENNARYPADFTEVVIGNTRIELSSNGVLVSQAGGVTRDLLSLRLGSPYSENLVESFSGDVNEKAEYRGWNEGARIKELKAIGLRHEIASGTIVKELDGTWYAPNEEGIFMFEVPAEQVLYPTTRFLQNGLAVIVDTQGIGVIAGQAVKKNATAVIGSCDSRGDAKAAKYLSDAGVKVICSSDRYVPLLIGENTNVVGSAAFSIENDNAVFGSRPITISKNEPAIAMDTVSKVSGMAYYDTPARYFSELEKKGVKLNVFIAEVDDFNQMDKVIKKAKEKKANVIAVRVFNSDDYNKAKAWLEENPEHKAILFASENSAYGYKLSREFRSQTSFDDPNPVAR